jgi:hypothetical protein
VANLLSIIIMQVKAAANQLEPTLHPTNGSAFRREQLKVGKEPEELPTRD